jgi:hypothetical protein
VDAALNGGPVEPATPGAAAFLEKLALPPGSTPSRGIKVVPPAPPEEPTLVTVSHPVSSDQTPLVDSLVAAGTPVERSRKVSQAVRTAAGKKFELSAGRLAGFLLVAALGAGALVWVLRPGAPDGKDSLSKDAPSSVAGRSAGGPAPAPVALEVPVTPSAPPGLPGPAANSATSLTTIETLPDEPGPAAKATRASRPRVFAKAKGAPKSSAVTVTARPAAIKPAAPKQSVAKSSPPKAATQAAWVDPFAQ